MRTRRRGCRNHVVTAAPGSHRRPAPAAAGPRRNSRTRRTSRTSARRCHRPRSWITGRHARLPRSTRSRAWGAASSSPSGFTTCASPRTGPSAGNRAAHLGVPGRWCTAWSAPASPPPDRPARA